MVTTGELLGFGQKLVEVAFPARRIGFLAVDMTEGAGRVENPFVRT
jgi:hypothetical protein